MHRRHRASFVGCACVGLTTRMDDESPPSLSDDEHGAGVLLKQSGADDEPPSLSDGDGPDEGSSQDAPSLSDDDATDDASRELARANALFKLLSPDVLETSMLRNAPEGARLLLPDADLACRLLSVVELEGRAVSAGRKFEHRIKLGNVGRVAWPAGWTVVAADGDAGALRLAAVGGRDLGAPVQPGATADVTMQLVAPAAKGPTFSFFALCVAGGGGRKHLLAHEWSVMVNIV